MAIEKDALREMARHRGLMLKASRRRKPGGDFAKFGLTDAKGAAVLGIGKSGLTASADEVEAYLRDATRATWKTSAGSAKIKKAPPPPKPPKPKPPPKLAIANLFDKLPAAKRAEASTAIVERQGTRIERIVSNGQATPTDEPMRQDHDEWVIVLRGEAGLRIEQSAEAVLRPGDHILIERGKRHWVTYTAKDGPTVWLAVHFG
jgi:mannose-6-phosphate isomerase-like protein (cupin superfamily)